jgi:branched-chain amino acid transport system permease protein
MDIVVSGILNGAFFATVGVGLSLVFGVIRLVNLAHGELIVLGSYLASVVSTWLGVDPFVALVVVAPLCALLAYPVQRFLLTGLLRRGLEPPLVATFGISLLVSAALTQLFGGSARSLSTPYASAGVDLLGMRLRVIDLIGLVVSIVLVLAVHFVLRRTSWGTALRASAADPVTAGSMGINVNVVYAATFAVSAAIAAVGGVLIGTAYSFSPTSGANYMLIGFTVVVLGGTGSALGALWGGLALGLVQSVGSAMLGGQYRDFVIYAAFIVILAVRPLVERLVMNARGAIAQRRLETREVTA